MSKECTKIIKGIATLFVAIMVLGGCAKEKLVREKNFFDKQKLTMQETKEVMKISDEYIMIHLGTQEEYDLRHIKGARFLDVNNTQKIETLQIDKESCILIGGDYSDETEKLAREMSDRGYKQVYDIGNILYWNESDIEAAEIHETGIPFVDELPDKEVDELPDKEIDELLDKEIDELPDKEVDDKKKQQVEVTIQDKQPTLESTILQIEDYFRKNIENCLVESEYGLDFKKLYVTVSIFGLREAVCESYEAGQDAFNTYNNELSEQCIMLTINASEIGQQSNVGINEVLINLVDQETDELFLQYTNGVGNTDYRENPDYRFDIQESIGIIYDNPNQMVKAYLDNPELYRDQQIQISGFYDEEYIHGTTAVLAQVRMGNIVMNTLGQAVWEEVPIIVQGKNIEQIGYTAVTHPLVEGVTYSKTGIGILKNKITVIPRGYSTVTDSFGRELTFPIVELVSIDGMGF